MNDDPCPICGIGTVVRLRDRWECDDCGEVFRSRSEFSLEEPIEDSDDGNDYEARMLRAERGWRW